MMEVQAAEELYQEYCNFIFDYVDKDGSGKISKSELKYDVYHWFIHSCKLFHALFSPQKTLLNWCLLLKNINHDRAQKITDSNESDCRKTFVLSVISFIFLVKTVFIFFCIFNKTVIFWVFCSTKGPWLIVLDTFTQNKPFCFQKQFEVHIAFWVPGLTLHGYLSKILADLVKI